MYICYSIIHTALMMYVKNDSQIKASVAMYSMYKQEIRDKRVFLYDIANAISGIQSCTCKSLKNCTNILHKAQCM